MANPVISSYLADPSVPVDVRRSVATNLNSGKLSESDAVTGITSKYGQKYGSSSPSSAGNSGSNSSAGSNLAGNLVKGIMGGLNPANLPNTISTVASKLSTKAPQALSAFGKSVGPMSPEDQAKNAAADTAKQEARQTEAKNAQYLNSKGIVPDSNATDQQVNDQAQAIRIGSGDIIPQTVGDATGKILGATGDALKSGLIQGGEGIQKVGAAITGDTDSLEGYRSFYGLKSPEQAGHDMTQLDPGQRGEMLGEGLTQGVSGTLNTAFSPASGVINSDPTLKAGMDAANNAVIKPAVQFGANKLKDALKASGVTLTPEQEATIDEGVGNIANLFMLKTGEEAADYKTTEATKASLSNTISDALKKGDLETAKNALGEYEKVVSKAPTSLPGRVLGAASEGASKATKDAIDSTGQALNTIKDKTLTPLNDLATKVSEKIITATKKIDPSKVNEFTNMTGDNPGKWLQDRGIIADRKGTISQLVQYWQKSKEAVDSTLAQIPTKYAPEAARKILNDQVKYFADVEDPKNLALSKERLNKIQNGEGLTLSEINDVKRTYERTEKMGYVKEQNSKGVTRATNLDSAMRTFIEDKAAEHGFDNLKQFNKETQSAKFLADQMYKKLNKQAANDALGLTDKLMVIGSAINPASLAKLGLAKIALSDAAQTALAKILAPEASKGLPIAPIPTLPSEKLLPAPKEGEPDVQINQPINLPSKTQSTIDAAERSRRGG